MVEIWSFTYFAFRCDTSSARAVIPSSPVQFDAFITHNKHGDRLSSPLSCTSEVLDINTEGGW